MIKNLILLLFALSISLVSCTALELQTPHGTSKYYSSKDKSEGWLKPEYKKLIYPFKEDYIHNKKSDSTRRFECIQPNNLETIIKQYNSVLLTFWHRCPSSLKQIQKAQHIADSLQAKLLIVSTDYELEMLCQHLDSIDYKNTVYIAENTSQYTLKMKKKLQFIKPLIPKTYKVLLDHILLLNYFYFDNSNPENNFSTNSNRYINAKPGFKKITSKNALEVFYHPIQQKR